MRLGKGLLFVVLVVLSVTLPIQAISSPPHPEPARSGFFSESLHLNSTTQGSLSAVPFWNNSSVWEGYTFGFSPASSPWGAFGLTYAFGGRIQLTGGAIDAGTNRTGRVTVEAPSYSELNVTVASQSVSVPLPNPLGLNQSFAVASLDLQLDVPYLGSLTLADFSLAIVASVEIEGDSAVAGCGTGAGHLVWDGGGGFGMTACARNLTIGSRFASTLSNISLALAVGVQAEAEITPFYTDVISIIPMTPLVPLPAPVSSVQSTFSVVSPLSHLHAYVAPNPTDYNDTVYVYSNVSGGAGNVSYGYRGTLPGLGCSSVRQGVLKCTAWNVGNFSFLVTATDQEGANVSMLVSYSASPPPPVQDAILSLPSWSEIKYGLESLGGVLLGFLVIVVIIRYLGGRRDYSASRGPYEEEFSTSHRKTTLNYADERSERFVYPHQTPSSSRSATARRSSAGKSVSTRRPILRDPRTGRFVSSSSSKRRRSGTKSTKANGHRPSKRTRR
ncbi:MAG: hypothetical protein M1305_00615 [Candidatus Marsarchaeota archaeon]|nr:hypothetical protein [Candidatus Marsarchaeota archaeon]